MGSGGFSVRAGRQFAGEDNKGQQGRWLEGVRVVRQANIQRGRSEEGCVAREAAD